MLLSLYVNTSLGRLEDSLPHSLQPVTDPSGYNLPSYSAGLGTEDPVLLPWVGSQFSQPRVHLLSFPGLENRTLQASVAASVLSLSFLSLPGSLVGQQKSIQGFILGSATYPDVGHIP